MLIISYFLTSLLAVGLLLAQVFVYPNYQPVPLTSVIKYLPQLRFSPPGFNPSSSVTDSLEIKTDCPDVCSFSLIDSKTKEVVRTIPAIIDVDASGRLKELTLQFFDPEHQLIGYQNVSVENPMFYVIDFEPQLIQAIQLKPNQQIEIKFSGYDPTSQRILFTSAQDQYLYSANQPALQIL